MFAKRKIYGFPLFIAALAIATSAAAQVKQRDAIRGWTISQDYRSGHFYQCFAETTGAGNSGLRLSFMANFDRHLSVEAPAAKWGGKDRVRIVMVPSGDTFQFNMIRIAGDQLWGPRPLANTFTDSLDEAKSMTVEFHSDHSQRSFALDNTATMFSAVDGCLIENTKR